MNFQVNTEKQYLHIKSLSIKLNYIILKRFIILLVNLTLFYKFSTMVFKEKLILVG